jgi:mannose-6-phosphate isomerase
MPAYKLPSNQFDHFYKGGNRIGALRHGPGGPMRPEEWIGSTTTRFGEPRMGLSTLPTGELLIDALTANPEHWLGREHINTFGVSTELLVKLLDPDQRLPVHYHPNRKFAQEHLSLKHGKTEAWIILEAPSDAYVGLGFSKTKSKKEVASMVDARDADGLLASLQKFPAKQGDAILVPAGVPHAIGAGIFVLELQEPTDMSALLEWNDFAVDGVKDGHLGLGFDTVLDALRYTPIDKAEAEKLVTPKRLFGESDAAVFTQAANPYFRADYLTGKASKVDAGFAILLVLDSAGSLTFSNSETMDVEKGDAILIPYSNGEWTLNGASGIVCRPPQAQYASLAI